MRHHRSHKSNQEDVELAGLLINEDGGKQAHEIHDRVGHNHRLGRRVSSYSDTSDHQHGLTLQGMDEDEILLSNSMQRTPKKKRRSWWRWLDWDSIPLVYTVPDKTKPIATGTAMCLLGVALLLIVSVLITVLSNLFFHRAHYPQYSRYGMPTMSDKCLANQPRTYCGAIDIDKHDCERVGCCWLPLSDANHNVPSCVHSNDEQGQYTVVSKQVTANGIQAELQLRTSVLQNLGPDEQRLRVTIQYHTDSRLHIHIAPVGGQTWEVPESLIPRPPAPGTAPTAPQYRISMSDVNQDFWVEVHRIDAAGNVVDALPIFSTKGWGLVFKQQYLQLTTVLQPGSAVMGLGESTFSTGLIMPRNGKLVTLWNMDIAATANDINLYGSHPFFMELRKGQQSQSTAAHGVFLLNSNGMDIELWDNHLTYRPIGGVLDFWLFTGPSPETVIQQYQELIGRPALPPLWSLGFHQCRWGYADVNTLLDVVQRYQQEQLPLDVLWSDIDYMLDYRVWTLDPDKYPIDKMKPLVDWLHSQHMKWVPIQDPAVQLNPAWSVWTEGVAQGVFIRDANGQEPYLGQVWAGPSAWPDFFNPTGIQYWGNNIKTFRGLVPADGLWLDMNEISNFCNGRCTLPKSKLVLFWRALTRCRTCCILDCVAPPGDSKLDYPPYQINNLGSRQPLQTKTVTASSVHSNGFVEYNVHNLYSLAEAQASYAILAEQTGQRPFLLTRSSFPGMGRYSAHWTGDNTATWNDLRWSIAGVLSSNMWGMPLVGADICGFMQNTYEELCARWIEAGAFYPFSRNHGDYSSPRHEAYIWPLTKLASKTAMGLRYRLLPYLYTAFYQASLVGGTVARPLAFEWPDDMMTWQREPADTQWMLGSSLMIAPVIQQNTRSRTLYFPSAIWYRLIPDVNEAPRTQDVKYQGPQTTTVSAEIGQPSVWLRSGSILPWTTQYATTTHTTLDNPLQLIVAMPAQTCSDKKPEAVDAVLATGQLYMDDGVSLPNAERLEAIGAKAAAVAVSGMPNVPQLYVNFTAVCNASSPGSFSGVVKFVHAGEVVLKEGASWQPTGVMIAGINTLGASACRACPARQLQQQQAPLETSLTASIELDPNRPDVTGALSDQACTTAADAKYDDQSDQLVISFQRPIPMLCIAAVNWHVQP